MIICAAIQFQMKKTGQVVTLCGLRHGDTFSQMVDMGLRPGEDYIVICKGFINDKGEFLDRCTAFDHAFKIGQLSMTTYQTKHERHETELYSEDLW